MPAQRSVQRTIRKISFLVDARELELLEEACLYGADADDHLARAVIEKGRYRLAFLYDELDDVAGYVASCANHETAKAKRARWDALCGKLEALLRLSEHIPRRVNPPTPPKPPRGLRYHIFDVWLDDERKRKILRRIQIADIKTLYSFARVITKAFGFYFDHCFGFYDNFAHYHDSTKAYELFADIGEEPVSPTTKGVKKTQLRSVFKQPGEKMLFLFDYGDGWHFAVELKEIRHAERWDLKPVILERHGKAPLQYPPEDARL